MNEHVYGHTWAQCADNPPKDVFTIDESDEVFPCHQVATAAAMGKVNELRRTINVYRNGELYDTRRF